MFTKGMDICKNLWCYKDTAMCETKFLPAAEGTACGYGMVGRQIIRMYWSICSAYQNTQFEHDHRHNDDLIWAALNSYCVNSAIS